MAQDNVDTSASPGVPPPEVEEVFEPVRYGMVDALEPKPQRMAKPAPVEYEPDPVKPEPKIKEAVFIDPYRGVSPDMRKLLIVQAAADKRIAEQQVAVNVVFAEEEDPSMMARFISGPLEYNANGSFNCTFHHPVYGDIPFTASADDDVAYGRAAHAYILRNLSKLGGYTNV